MALRSLGFGVELEISAEPYANESWTSKQHYVKLAQTLTQNGLRAVANTGQRKNPEKYDKWWITQDLSIASFQYCVNMEAVSPIMKSSHRWEDTVAKFWEVMADLFDIKKNLTCGTHIHVAPWQARFTLQQAQTIAFACCYWEPYVVSFLPVERRDYGYCQRNTALASRMGYLYRKETPSAWKTIAHEIKRTNNFEELCTYMQGGMGSDHRKVLWNFQNLCNETGTIEFRGGRHMRGPNRTLRWVTFTIVFVLMALETNLIHTTEAYYVPNNDTAREVQWFWSRLTSLAHTLNMGSSLPKNFKMMSEKMAEG